MTVLPELVPLAIEMSKRKLTGIMNYTNPGAISHNEILELYKQYIDPDFSWSNFTVEEQAKVIVAPRSNNLLDTDRMKVRPRSLFAVGVGGSTAWVPAVLRSILQPTSLSLDRLCCVPSLSRPCFVLSPSRRGCAGRRACAPHRVVLELLQLATAAGRPIPPDSAPASTESSRSTAR